jgi:hypothetical protein
MPFDPSLPQDNTTATAAQMRAQLTGLKDLFDQLQAQVAAQANAIASLQNQVSSLIPDTPHNPASVSNLSLSLSNPPQSFEVQQIIDKVNEMLNVMRR